MRYCAAGCTSHGHPVASCSRDPSKSYETAVGIDTFVGHMHVLRLHDSVVSVPNLHFLFSYISVTGPPINIGLIVVAALAAILVIVLIFCGAYHSIKCSRPVSRSSSSQRSTPVNNVRGEQPRQLLPCCKRSTANRMECVDEHALQNSLPGLRLDAVRLGVDISKYFLFVEPVPRKNNVSLGDDAEQTELVDNVA